MNDKPAIAPSLTLSVVALGAMLSACSEVGLAVVGWDSSVDVPTEPMGCRSDMDCVGHPEGSVCDTRTGRCVPPPCQAPMQMCGELCVDVRTSAMHCGACGRVCTAGAHARAVCEGGLCGRPVCDEGYGDCDGVATNGCEADLRTSSAHCGTCGSMCVAGSNATAMCVGGTCMRTGCVAGSGFEDCDMDLSNGCEVNTRTSVANCGMCGRMCPSGAHSTPTCAAGMCGLTCDTGYADCNINPMDGCEVDTRTSTDHCGMCGRACVAGSNSMATCSGGVCGAVVCTPGSGFADCNMMSVDGCEVNTQTNPAHCGMCGRTCPSGPHSTATCTGGTCGITCEMGWADCDRNPANGCEVNTQTDIGNCGACSNRCMLAHATSTCAMGACAIVTCDADYADCDRMAPSGCESHLPSDNSNCGMCGRACTMGARCQFSYCNRFPSDGSEGPFAPTANVTLPPGVRNYTTITIPPGVTVRSDGNGPLDLRATGPIVVNGIIDLSGGDGGRVGACNNSGSGGGATGTSTAGATNATCPAGALSCGGPGGPGGAGSGGLVGSLTAGGGGGLRGGGGGGGYVATGSSAGSGGGGGGGGFAGGGGAAGAGRGCGAALGNGGAGGAGGGPGGASGGSLAGTPGIGGNAGTGMIGLIYNGTSGLVGALCSTGGAYGGGGGGGSIGAAAAADLAIDRDTFQPGSAGGGGGGPSGGGGGGGGGAIRLASPVSITLGATGQVLARGGSGAQGACGGGGGGGGSGGLIYFYAPGVTVPSGSTVGADFGGGGFTFGGGGLGGPGGIGRVRISVLPTRCSLAPVFRPTLDEGCGVTPGSGTPDSAYIRSYPE